MPGLAHPAPSPRPLRVIEDVGGERLAYRVAEAAALLGVHPKTLLRMHHRGELAGSPLGGGRLLLFTRTSIEAALSRSRIGGSAP